MSKVRITRQNVNQYINSGQIDPSKVRIDLNKTKTANDNVERWVTLQSAIDSGYDFNFDYEIKDKPKQIPKETMLDELVVVAPKKKEINIPKEQTLNIIDIQQGRNHSDRFENAYYEITDPLLGEQRTANMNKVNPQVMDNWQLLQNVGDFIDVNLYPWFKITRPTWWMNNIAKGRIANPLDYNEHDNGIYDFPTLQQYANEWYAPFVNLGLDGLLSYGLGKGIQKFNVYRNTPIELGKGAEMQRVYTYPGSKWVYKEGFLPEERRLQIGRNAPLTQVGTTPEGIPILKQRKLNKSKDINFEQIKKLLKRQNFYEMKFPGDTQTVFYNPYTDEVALDWRGNFGTLNGRTMMYDPLYILRRPEYMASLKIGGKLIPKIRKFQIGGQSQKYGKDLNNKNIFEGIITTNNRPYNYKDIEYINSKLSSIPTLQRASILANIIEESGGDPYAVGPRGFYGLLQWGPQRYKKKSNDRQKELDYQIQYIIDTMNNTTDRMSWNHGGKGSGYQTAVDANKAFNNSSNIYDINKAFVLGYVRPAGGFDSVNNRNKVAEQLYNILTKLDQQNKIKS